MSVSYYRQCSGGSFAKNPSRHPQRARRGNRSTKRKTVLDGHILYVPQGLVIAGDSWRQAAHGQPHLTLLFFRCPSLTLFRRCHLGMSSEFSGFEHSADLLHCSRKQYPARWARLLRVLPFLSLSLLITLFPMCWTICTLGSWPWTWITECSGGT